MIQKVKSLVGRIDCPHCFSLLQWDNKEDVHISNGNKYVICPECGEHIILNQYHDYWLEPEDSDSDSDDSGSGGDSGSQQNVITFYADYRNDPSDPQITLSEENDLNDIINNPFAYKYQIFIYQSQPYPIEQHLSSPSVAFSSTTIQNVEYTGVIINFQRILFDPSPTDPSAIVLLRDITINIISTGDKTQVMQSYSTSKVLVDGGK